MLDEVIDTSCATRPALTTTSRAMPERAKTGGRVSQLQLPLTPEDRDWLEHWVRASRLPYGLHKRARAVLLVAAGLPIAEVARRVDMGRHHVYMWLRRFQAQGCEGLLDSPRHSPTQGRWAARRKEENDGRLNVRCAAIRS